MVGLRVWCIVLLVVLTVLPLSSALETSYEFTVAENGETHGLVTVEGKGTVIVALPPDVVAPEIQGGSYSIVEGGVELVVEDGTVLSYDSSFHTNKQGGIWYFYASTHGDTTLRLPATVQVIQSLPKSVINRETDTLLVWEAVSDAVNVSYVIPRSASVVVAAPQFQWWPVVFFVLVALGVLWLRKRPKKSGRSVPSSESPQSGQSVTASQTSEDSPTITDGQMNIMRAANPNEAVVLKSMLKHNGQMKRNVLEKETGLSKSSLASSLKNLEHKNIIEIDRSFHVHYLKFSAWFKEL